MLVELWVYAGLRGADLENVPEAELVALIERILKLPPAGQFVVWEKGG